MTKKELIAVMEGLPDGTQILVPAGMDWMEPAGGKVVTVENRHGRYWSPRNPTRTYGTERTYGEMDAFLIGFTSYAEFEPTKHQGGARIRGMTADLPPGVKRKGVDRG